MKRLGYVEWTKVYETVNVNEAYNKFINIFSNLYNNCCPIVKVKCRNIKGKPWITNGVRNTSRKKNYLYKLFIKNKHVIEKTDITRRKGVFGPLARAQSQQRHK